MSFENRTTHYSCFLLSRISGGLVALEPIAGAFEAENVGVMHDPVDHRGCDGLIAEDLAPTEGQIAREDQRRMLIPGRDELEEQARGVLIEWNVSNFVDRCR